MNRTSARQRMVVLTFDTVEAAEAWEAAGCPLSALDDNASYPRPRRVRLTRKRLAEVAAAYERGGGLAVEWDCNVSKSQAFRLIGQARDAGLLPPKDAA